jgi:tellurite resistance protein TerC
MNVTLFHWVFFNIFIVILIAIDLWHFRRHPQSKSFKESLVICLGWISLALLFNVWIYFKFGSEPALNFLTGYLLEESLSVDNLFIFLIVFAYFKVPESSKHLVLFYGVLSAIVMRGLLIWGGIIFVEYFTWAFYVFGAFLIYTGIKLALTKGEQLHIKETMIYKLFNRYIGMTHEYHGESFLIKQGTKWIATPLLLVLVLIETADLVFALDSVPAILGITTEPFIVYTSNIFAVLGLRSLFFVLEKGMNKFHYIHEAVSAILVFIGIKMLIKDFYHIPTAATLLVLVVLLGGAILLSHIFPQKEIKEEDGLKELEDIKKP